MVDGLHLYSAFTIYASHSPIHTHIHTQQRRLAAMQGTDQLVRSNRGLGVLLRDTSTRPGWDRTGDPPTAYVTLYLIGLLQTYGSHPALTASKAPFPRHCKSQSPGCRQIRRAEKGLLPPGHPNQSLSSAVRDPPVEPACGTPL